MEELRYFFLLAKAPTLWMNSLTVFQEDWNTEDDVTQDVADGGSEGEAEGSKLSHPEWHYTEGDTSTDLQLPRAIHPRAHAGPKHLSSRTTTFTSHSR